MAETRNFIKLLFAGYIALVLGSYLTGEYGFQVNLITAARWIFTANAVIAFAQNRTASALSFYILAMCCGS
ncbi:MAG: hypothetical protein ACR2P5_07845 [Gammaproteobacteria bacterium]